MFIYQVNQRKLRFFRYSQLLTQLLVCGCLLLAVTEKSVLKSVLRFQSRAIQDFKSASAFIKTMEQKYEKNKIYKNSKIFSKLK